MGILELVGILREEELEGSVVPGGTVDNPHRDDETYGSKDTDRREILDGIPSMVFQNGESCGIGKRQRWHVERHAEGIDSHEERLVRSGTRLSHHEKSYHRQASQQMAVSKKALWLDIFISNNTHQSRHEDGNNPLDGIEPRDFSTHSGFAEIVAHRCEIGSPNSELQEVHY